MFWRIVCLFLLLHYASAQRGGQGGRGGRGGGGGGPVRSPTSPPQLSSAPTITRSVAPTISGSRITCHLHLSNVYYLFGSWTDLDKLPTALEEALMITLDFDWSTAGIGATVEQQQVNSYGLDFSFFITVSPETFYAKYKNLRAMNNVIKDHFLGSHLKDCLEAGELTPFTVNAIYNANIEKVESSSTSFPSGEDSSSKGHSLSTSVIISIVIAIIVAVSCLISLYRYYFLKTQQQPVLTLCPTQLDPTILAANSLTKPDEVAPIQVPAQICVTNSHMKGTITTVDDKNLVLATRIEQL